MTVYAWVTKYSLEQKHLKKERTADLKIFRQLSKNKWHLRCFYNFARIV